MIKTITDDKKYFYKRYSVIKKYYIETEIKLQELYHEYSVTKEQLFFQVSMISYLEKHKKMLLLEALYAYLSDVIHVANNSITSKDIEKFTFNGKQVFEPLKQKGGGINNIIFFVTFLMAIITLINGSSEVVSSNQNAHSGLSLMVRETQLTASSIDEIGNIIEKAQFPTKDQITDVFDFISFFDTNVGTTPETRFKSDNKITKEMTPFTKKWAEGLSQEDWVNILKKDGNGLTIEEIQKREFLKFFTKKHLDIINTIMEEINANLIASCRDVIQKSLPFNLPKTIPESFYDVLKEEYKEASDKYDDAKHINEYESHEMADREVSANGLSAPPTMVSAISSFFPSATPAPHESSYIQNRNDAVNEAQKNHLVKLNSEAESKIVTETIQNAERKFKGKFNPHTSFEDLRKETLQNVCQTLFDNIPRVTMVDSTITFTTPLKSISALRILLVNILQLSDETEELKSVREKALYFLNWTDNYNSDTIAAFGFPADLDIHKFVNQLKNYSNRENTQLIRILNSMPMTDLKKEQESDDYIQKEKFEADIRNKEAIAEHEISKQDRENTAMYMSDLSDMAKEYATGASNIIIKPMEGVGEKLKESAIGLGEGVGEVLFEGIGKPIIGRLLDNIRIYGPSLLCVVALVLLFFGWRFIVVPLETGYYWIFGRKKAIDQSQNIKSSEHTQTDVSQQSKSQFQNIETSEDTQTDVSQQSKSQTSNYQELYDPDEIRENIIALEKARGRSYAKISQLKQSRTKEITKDNDKPNIPLDKNYRNLHKKRIKEINKSIDFETSNISQINEMLEIELNKKPFKTPFRMLKMPFKSRHGSENNFEKIQERKTNNLKKTIQNKRQILFNAARTASRNLETKYAKMDLDESDVMETDGGRRSRVQRQKKTKRRRKHSRKKIRNRKYSRKN
jgi:hypothetical protein